MIADLLYTWFEKNKRDLPWRNTQNPYKIWLSEIILQQTRVAQGLPYYHKFLENFPDIQSFANAPLDEILRLWQGLGYYSRGRNMHTAAKIIVENYNSVFPKTYKELLKLKGIGNYTASAIASFSFDEKVAVLDGNVIRVLTRLFAIEDDVSLMKTINKLQKLAENILPNHKVNIHNQAIMEFGALQCVPKNPNCQTCCMNHICEAHNQKKVKTLPFKSKKIKPKERLLHYNVIVNENKILMRKRPKGDIWEGLYDFVGREYESFYCEKEFVFSQSVKHILTHQILKIQFDVIKTDFSDQNFVAKNNLLLLSYEESKLVGKPIVIHNFIENNRNIIFE